MGSHHRAADVIRYEQECIAYYRSTPGLGCAQNKFVHNVGNMMLLLLTLLPLVHLPQFEAAATTIATAVSGAIDGRVATSRSVCAAAQNNV